MQDEGFHEIQLNGKQLVFLFMAATVVAVVVFLCGVMVGRGVPAQRTLATDLPEQVTIDPTSAARPSSAPFAVASTGTAPVAASETLTYAPRLEDPNPPAETLKPPSEAALPPVAAAPPALAPRPPVRAPEPVAAPAPKKVAAAVAPKPPAPAALKPAAVPAPKPAAVPAPKPAPVAPVTASVDSSVREPAGKGFVVQVAAVRQRAEAEAIARRLTAKGYPTFVTTSGANFRIRVGKYDDRRAAEAVAARLQQEERFKPWITR